MQQAFTIREPPGSTAWAPSQCRRRHVGSYVPIADGYAHPEGRLVSKL